jgi:hypothetical protein
LGTGNNGKRDQSKFVVSVRTTVIGLGGWKVMNQNREEERKEEEVEIDLA